MSILDEIDSGLDVDALRDVAKAVNGLLTSNNSVLMITHYLRLLEFIKPKCIHVMVSHFDILNTWERRNVSVHLFLVLCKSKINKILIKFGLLRIIRWHDYSVLIQSGIKLTIFTFFTVMFSYRIHFNLSIQGA